MRVLLIDHRDSFAWNVAHGLELGARQLGLELELDLRRPEELSLEGIHGSPPERIVLGPGPGGPTVDRGALARDLVLSPPENSLLLGVCLGHQLLAHALGATVEPGPRPVHGHVDRIEHDGRGLFRDLPSPLAVGRYHSLVVRADSLPAELEVSARGDAGLVMGLRHRTRGIESVQFHPDSVLSDSGPALFANFLAGPGPTSELEGLRAAPDASCPA